MTVTRRNEMAGQKMLRDGASWGISLDSSNGECLAQRIHRRITETGVFVLPENVEAIARSVYNTTYFKLPDGSVLTLVCRKYLVGLAVGCDSWDVFWDEGG
jgi:hypothetical protein